MRNYKLGLGYLFSAFLGAWSGGKAMLDWIGRIGAAQDASNPDGLTAKALLWLFGTPWWVPGLIAVVFGFILLRYLANSQVSKPDEHRSHLSDSFFKGSPGQGGSVRIRGTRSSGVGGGSGVPGLTLGGSGGHVDIEGDESFGKGGEGGNAPQADGRGGRRTRGAMEGSHLPTQVWAAGHGGHGANTPEYDRRLALLIQIKREYYHAFPGDIQFIEAGIDFVPDYWINARLREINEKWRVNLGRYGYEMI